MTHSYEYDVQMSCGGCASAVRKAVTALSDVQSVETSVEKQKVNVIVADDVTFDQVKLAIQNAGKQVKGGRVRGRGSNGDACASCGELASIVVYGSEDS